MCISLNPHWNIVAGLSTTIALGFLLPRIMNKIAEDIGVIDAPNQDVFLPWFRLMVAKSGGYWIGTFERPMFYAFFSVSGLWPLIGAWLVMKTAFYWQGSNFAAFPDKVLTLDEMNFLVAKRRIGSYYAATVLTGTGANIVFALVGVAVSRWIAFPT